MKKIIASCLALVCIVAFAAGCSQQLPQVDISSVDDLAGKTIGVQLGTTGDSYVSDIPDAKVERYNKGFEAVQALQQGKIDAVMIDDQVAKNFAAQNDDIKVLEEPFTEEDYALCVAKGNTELTEQLNAAMAELKEDGTMQAMLDYWIEQKEDAAPYESPADIQYDGQLVMATNAEFPPYEYYDGDQIVGFDVDLAKAICDKLGKELVIEDMAFDSIIAAVQSGKADFGAAGLTIREDRLENVDFTDTYCHASQVIIIRK